MREPSYSIFSPLFCLDLYLKIPYFYININSFFFSLPLANLLSQVQAHVILLSGLVSSLANFPGESSSPDRLTPWLRSGFQSPQGSENFQHPWADLLTIPQIFTLLVFSFTHTVAICLFFCFPLTVLKVYTYCLCILTSLPYWPPDFTALLYSSWFRG